MLAGLCGPCCLNVPKPFLQTKREEEHKLVKSKVVNEEEVVRVPLAFAMVKLMRSLPQEVMEANLPRYIIGQAGGLQRNSDLLLSPGFGISFVRKRNTAMVCCRSKS